MTLTELTKVVGAPNEDALRMELDSLGVTVQEVAGSADHQELLKGYFADKGASSLAVAQESAPVKAKRGRKPKSAASAIENAQAQSSAGSTQLTAQLAGVSGQAMTELRDLGQGLSTFSEQVSDAAAKMILATPGYIDQMTAAKVAEGAKNRKGSFRHAEALGGAPNEISGILGEFELACD